MAITKQDIADALGLSTERIDDIFGIGNRGAVNEKAIYILKDALERGTATSESLLADSRQQLADLQAEINKRVGAHEAIFAEFRVYLKQAENQEFTDSTLGVMAERVNELLKAIV
jgi:hypothetical protein